VRILIVDSSSHFGGAFELALILCRYLKQIPGVDVVLVSAQPAEILRARVEGICRYHYLSASSLSANSGPWLYRKLSALLSFLYCYIYRGLKLGMIARRERVDLIHLNNVLTGQCHGVVAALLAGVPCISVHRGYEYHSRTVRLFERGVTHHIASSEPVRQDLLKLGVPSEKISILSDGIDLETFSPDIAPVSLEREFGIPGSRRVFSIFGRVMPWKGQDLVIQALPQILKAVPDAQLLIVGGRSDGAEDYLQLLEQLVRDLKLTEHVTFAGYRSDVAALMRASEVLVHATISPEPFGTVILEGMACSKPYVAMNEGGPAVMLEDGVSGYLIEPNNPELIARRVIALLKDRAKSANMGSAARERIERLFSGKQFAESHLALYRRFAD
jgi:glycosyltransferase involved in cell wall biosynthesis